MTPSRKLAAGIHQLDLATKAAEQLTIFYHILSQNGSQLMPDENVTSGGLAKHFRSVANLEYLIDIIEAG